MTPVPWCDIAVAGFPPELEARVRTHLAAVAYLIPSWCRQLTLEYADEARGEEVAWIQARVEYRHATISLAPTYFVPSQAGHAQRYLRHEFLHLAMWPLSSAADALVERLIGGAAGTAGEALKAWAGDELRRGLEAATEDLALALTRRRRPPEPGRGKARRRR